MGPPGRGTVGSSSRNWSGWTSGGDTWWPRAGRRRRGGRVDLERRIGPRWVRWVAVHSDYVEGRQFRDTQVEGPFAHWVHTHRVEPGGPGARILEDQVEYALPCGGLGRALGGRIARRML